MVSSNSPAFHRHNVRVAGHGARSHDYLEQPATVSADTDVLTNGTLAYAYDWGTNTAATTVNTVGFTGSSSITGASTNVTITVSTSTIGNNGTTFGSGAAAPFTNLSSAYSN